MREKRVQCAGKRHRSHWQTADVWGDTGPGVDARATRRQACRRCQVWRCGGPFCVFSGALGS